ncbi:hypothetical protein SISNIDRAFT_449143 [Sistotremastrum niveocremeum HHB9708]|uniref:Uncharacterized protein n=1 Tax=Sistotremastrum niveocremeum HHB9708 TaxID=1314777 RepID=A0A164Z6J9_9AGAM|nr:hypothetical protein SISNIDRAFT_449143 [Sistotremastrum niveocremeum HHB9708]
MTPKSTDNEDHESETRLDERDDPDEQEPIVNHYSWRDKLKALDEQFDSDDDADMGGAPPASNEQLPRMESTPAKRSAPLFLASPASVAMDGSPHQSSSKSKPPPKSLPASSPEASTSDHVHDAASPTSNVRKAKRGQSKTSKPKPLTKKQMNETIRESARIQSGTIQVIPLIYTIFTQSIDRRFDIPRPENQSIPYQHLLTGLRLVISRSSNGCHLNPPAASILPHL